MSIIQPIIGPLIELIIRGIDAPLGGGSQSLTDQVKALFANGEQGAWYDPSDFSTMFQDSEGTTPVTAVEQPVGLILDKSGRGNHASQPTAASRPVLSARVNLVARSEGPIAGINNTNGVTDAAIPISGYPSSWYFADNTIVRESTPHLSAIAGATATYSFIIQMDDNSLPVFGIDFRIYFGGVPVTSGGQFTLLSAGVYRFTYTGALTLPGSYNGVQKITSHSAKGFRIFGVQLEYGAESTRYQRVNADTDYDTVGFPHYLKFDGVDDFLSTGSIDFTSTDKMTVVAGVRKLSYAAVELIAELSSGVNNPGMFYFASHDDGGKEWASLARGDATAVASQVAWDATLPPDTAVLAITHDIAGDLSRLRRNGVVGNDGTGDKGTGNFGNYPMYFGRRGGISIPFNGHIYSLVVRGALTADLAPVETYVADKTGVTL